MDSATRNVHRSTVLILLTLIASAAAASSREEDLVTNLPDVPALNSKIYSGYVTVDENNGRALFYYFVEAKNNSLNKPLAMWLNGGPRCSSVGAGAFIENGPFSMPGVTPVINSYSWNVGEELETGLSRTPFNFNQLLDQWFPQLECGFREMSTNKANMLYVESPAGVGFSYSNTTSDYFGITDERTALDSSKFLQGWLQKFPEYKDRSFYLVGESYAGHYIPQLADLLVKNKMTSGLQLKGIMMGNPTIDINVDAGFLAMVFQLWTHGQVSDDTAATVFKECQGLVSNSSFFSVACDESRSMVLNEESGLIHNGLNGPLDIFNLLSDTCRRSSGLQKSQFQALSSPSTMFQGPDPCDSDNTATYLNRKDVQTALHARLINGSVPWGQCNFDLVYVPNSSKMQPILKYLLENDVRVWVYSGDQDARVPVTATRPLVNGFAKELGWNITSPYQPWLVDNQIGGWTIRYNTTLLYATVRGAGHMVPRDQPVRGLQLFKSFLEGTNLPLQSAR